MVDRKYRSILLKCPHGDRATMVTMWQSMVQYLIQLGMGTTLRPANHHGSELPAYAGANTMVTVSFIEFERNSYNKLKQPTTTTQDITKQNKTKQ